MDEVLVAPGIYEETVSFRGKRAHLLSEGGTGVTFIRPPAGAKGVLFNNGETSDAVISGFTITNAEMGIHAVSASPTIISNVMVGCVVGVVGDFASPTIRGNLIKDCSSVAIFFGGAGSQVADGNVIVGNGGGILLGGAGDPTISGNFIRGNLGQGIEMYNRSDANIVQNVIVGNWGNGIKADVPGGNRGPYVINNTIIGNGEAAIFTFGFHADSKIINNILSGEPALSIGNYGNSPPPTILFNDIFSPDENLFDQNGAITSLAQIPGNISADPLIVCAFSGDYRIFRGSPCIDAGSNGAPFLPATDFDGRARIISGSSNGLALVDIGAFEFDPAAEIYPCPSLIGPETLQVECGFPVTINVQAGEANGAALTVSWVLDGVILQTNQVPARSPSVVTHLSFTAELPLGTNHVVISAVDSATNDAFWSTTVVVVDTTPPRILSPTNMAVDFDNATGARVSFPQVATDRCSGPVAVDCSPPSGSLFPIGTNFIICSSSDASGNTAYAYVPLIVRGALGVHIGVLSELKSYQSGPSRRLPKLNAAVMALTATVTPNRWIDEMHLKPKGGDGVFNNDAVATMYLLALIRSSHDEPTKVLFEKSIDRLVKADRAVAQLQIEAAQLAGGTNSVSLIQKASKELAQGDQAAAKQQYAIAILHYENAWRIAGRVVAR